MGFKIDFLKTSIGILGLKDGLKQFIFWFYILPIQQFFWLNITHKTYCLYHGWHCRGDCKEEKLTNKKEILEHWKENDKEMAITRGEEDGICAYCGEEPGEKKIPNPNMDKLDSWLVCLDCDEVIKNQLKMSFGTTMKSEKMIEEAHNKLLEISKRTGKPIMNAQLEKTDKGYKSSSITYTGENEKDNGK